MNEKFISFWIEPTGKNGPIGFGVTAWSREDAVALIKEAGYQDDLTAGIVRENVHPHEINSYVASHSGPSLLRGVWYPCLNIGFGASGE